MSSIRESSDMTMTFESGTDVIGSDVIGSDVDSSDVETTCCCSVCSLLLIVISDSRTL